MRRVQLICLSALAVLFAGSATVRPAESKSKPVKYVRFQAGQTIAYGIVERDRIRQLEGNLFGKWKKTDTTYASKDVKLLVPTRPAKVIAMIGNYQSHLGQTAKPANPEVFFKLPSCLIADGENVVIPKGTAMVHHEAEMVIVIGKRAKNVTEAEALSYVFGVTCGNDISARDWQQNDRQWWRAKGSDTFGPCGPYIVTGVNYDDLLVQMRVNGEVRQTARTSELIFGVARMVSFISQHVTLEPGDLIYTGTPGQTTQIKPGDVMEVELEGAGVLRNGVAAAP